ncbi:hypothetical protein Y032_0048g1638 [Ancylostoma ceylanicum]|uniref:Glycosyltransferase family 92 protein n=2 Tax=Ancylostoma ceylanicum TaxID=53326 RepID=A0A016UB38_9BILA|nr:hypothetical protein Y032_0048g1638 [Ancylostoma ceylanicum]
MLTRISVITVDHETTISLGLEFPMMPVCELSFDEFTEMVPPNYEKAVRHQLFDIFRLRVAAMAAKKEMDVLIAAPNQVWTSYLLNRTMHLFKSHQDSEGLLLVQKLAAHLMTRKYTATDSALTYACDVPQRSMCRRLSPERMSGAGWFRGKREVAPDIVHLPVKTKISVLSNAGLWLLTDGRICSASLRENLILGDNSIALVLTGDFASVKALEKLQLVAWNNDTNVVANAEIQRITPHNVCRWISMFVTAPLLPDPNKLALSVGNKLVAIPFREPVAKRHEVVTCIAPLFGNEQWQQALFAAHVYKKFGTHMHLYVRSMVSPVFELLKIYESEGYLTIQPWLRISLLTISELDFNPNVNVEFRNQAAAQTDCLLQYKESASYIAFVDLDDVLIPRLAGSYLEEFAHLFHSMPNVAYIHYTKENTKLVAAKRPSDFSLKEMLTSIQFERVSETGKLVADPRHVNSTWIHFPVSIPEGMERYIVPNNVNAITHLKHMKLVTTTTKTLNGSPPAFKPNTYDFLSQGPLLSAKNINEIQKDFERMTSKPEVTRIFPKLPTNFIYLKAIAQCFEDTYYKYHYSGRTDEIKCPGPDRCVFPRGIPCYNSAAEYHSINDGSHVNLHFATNPSFKEEDGCRP